MKKRNLDFVLFDLIGTTIKDNKSGGSLILDSFHQAFAINGQQITYEALNQQRGKRKREAIQQILSNKQLDAKLVDKIYRDFMDLLNQSIHLFSEIEGATKVFQKIGDTKVDVQEGKNAKVLTAMVLTGTQNQENLGDVQADYIFESVNDLRTHYLLFLFLPNI